MKVLFHKCGYSGLCLGLEKYHGKNRQAETVRYIEEIVKRGKGHIVWK